MADLDEMGGCGNGIPESVELSFHLAVKVPVLPQVTSSPHMCDCNDHTPARTKAYSCWQALSGILLKVHGPVTHPEPITEVPVLP